MKFKTQNLIFTTPIKLTTMNPYFQNTALFQKLDNLAVTFPVENDDNRPLTQRIDQECITNTEAGPVYTHKVLWHLESAEDLGVDLEGKIYVNYGMDGIRRFPFLQITNDELVVVKPRAKIYFKKSVREQEVTDRHDIFGPTVIYSQLAIAKVATWELYKVDTKSLLGREKSSVCIIDDGEIIYSIYEFSKNSNLPEAVVERWFDGHKLVCERITGISAARLKQLRSHTLHTGDQIVVNLGNTTLTREF